MGNLLSSHTATVNMSTRGYPSRIPGVVVPPGCFDLKFSTHEPIWLPPQLTNPRKDVEGGGTAARTDLIAGARVAEEVAQLVKSRGEVHRRNGSSSSITSSSSEDPPKKKEESGQRSSSQTTFSTSDEAKDYLGSLGYSFGTTNVASGASWWHGFSTWVPQHDEVTEQSRANADATRKGAVGLGVPPASDYFRLLGLESKSA